MSLTPSSTDALSISFALKVIPSLESSDLSSSLFSSAKRGRPGRDYGRLELEIEFEFYEFLKPSSD